MSGNVTQDDDTFDGNNSLDDGRETNTDRNVGASVLTLARRDKNSAECDLKKAKVTAAVVQDSTILMLERDHANEKIVTLVDQQKRNEKTIEKLEKKIDDLEKELQKNKSTKQDTVADTVDAQSLCCEEESRPANAG
jgi:hypothetical protein